MKTSLAVVVLAVAVTGCQTNAQKRATVIPRPEGVYDVVSSWKTPDIPRRWNVEMAERTCDKKDKAPVVLEEKVAYKGIVKEEVNDKVSAGVAIGTTIGTVVTGIPLPVVDLRTKADYTVAFRFRCE